MAFNVVQVMKAFGKFSEARFISEDYNTLEEAKTELEDIRKATERSSLWKIDEELLEMNEIVAGYKMTYHDTVLDRDLNFEMLIIDNSKKNNSYKDDLLFEKSNANGEDSHAVGGDSSAQTPTY